MLAYALNLAAARDGDWQWLKGEEWTDPRPEKGSRHMLTAPVHLSSVSLHRYPHDQ